MKMLVSDTYGIGRESLPANIAVPLSHLSQKLDVYPSLDAAHVRRAASLDKCTMMADLCNAHLINSCYVLY